MTTHDIACLIADARRDISDADRCLMLSIEPSAGQLHRRLREVTEALASLSSPPADDAAGHLRDDMMICRKCGAGLSALDVVDGEKRCPGPRGTVTEAETKAQIIADLAESYAYVHAVSRTSSQVYKWLRARAEAAREARS